MNMTSSQFCPVNRAEQVLVGETSSTSTPCPPCFCYLDIGALMSGFGVGVGVVMVSTIVFVGCYRQSIKKKIKTFKSQEMKVMKKGHEKYQSMS